LKKIIIDKKNFFYKNFRVEFGISSYFVIITRGAIFFLDMAEITPSELDLVGTSVRKVKFCDL
tara:strand:+ start:404 stop:592 length:189 start_codon:yes stop_codon:yes gene_type:complete